MHPGVARGIILSIAVIAALGLAVIENPTVQEWLEEQRRKVMELLRTLGDELDPETRRTAEGFAYEGRNPTDTTITQREERASLDAVAIATGRSISNPSAVRRLPISGPTSPEQAEERRLKGQEYLARRESEMFELQQRLRATQGVDSSAQKSSPTFDTLVNAEGELLEPKENANGSESIRIAQPVPEAIKQRMKDVEQMLNPQTEGVDNAESGWQAGSHFGNPFGDEYALERSITPRPIVPPKLALSEVGSNALEDPPRAVTSSAHDERTPPQAAEISGDHENMSFEDQLALALALSHEESVRHNSQSQQDDDLDDDFKAAIAASLRDMEFQHAAAERSWPEAVSSLSTRSAEQPLVDVPAPVVAAPTAMSHRSPNPEYLFARPFRPSRTASVHSLDSKPVSEESDELYRVTPQLARAQLVELDSHPIQPDMTPQNPGLPYDPVHDSISYNQQNTSIRPDSYLHHVPLDASRESSHTLDGHRIHDEAHGAHEVGDSRASTPRAEASIGFRTDSDFDPTEMHITRRSDGSSQTASTISEVEVVDVEDDSDVDMLSEIGDRCNTPDSWTEIGSQDGESEDGDQEHHHSHVAA